jgi:hypothetical protein
MMHGKSNIKFNEVSLDEKCRTFRENNVASKMLVLET